MTESYQPSAPPTAPAKRRGPKPGTKRGPRKAANGEAEQEPNTTDHDILCAVANIGRLLVAYPAPTRQGVLKALNEMFG